MREPRDAKNRENTVYFCGKTMILKRAAAVPDGVLEGTAGHP
jgi:hypothetical protein